MHDGTRKKNRVRQNRTVRRIWGYTTLCKDTEKSRWSEDYRRVILIFLSPSEKGLKS